MEGLRFEIAPPRCQAIAIEWLRLQCLLTKSTYDMKQSAPKARGSDGEEAETWGENVSKRGGHREYVAVNGKIGVTFLTY